MNVKLLNYSDVDIEYFKEHLSYNFYFKGVTRALLQELARHRYDTNFSVKSSRYTLKELKKEDTFLSFNGCVLESTDIIERTGLYINKFNKNRASKYIKFTGNKLVDTNSVIELELLRTSIVNGISNDVAKYNLPECYYTELTFTIGYSSLRNFLNLRTSKAALEEIRELAKMVYENLPEDHKKLYIDCMQHD